MSDYVRKLAVPATIAVCFFLSGFFNTAIVLDLGMREIIIGLFSGAIGGLATLAVMLHQWSAGETPAAAE